MKKPVFILLAFFALCLHSNATLPVVDYSHIAQDAGNEVVNLAKWTKTEIDAAQTQLNTLNTWENTVLQVARFGNPARFEAFPAFQRLRNSCPCTARSAEATNSFKVSRIRRSIGTTSTQFSRHMVNLPGTGSRA